MKKILVVMLLVSMSMVFAGNGLFTPKGSFMVGGAYSSTDGDSSTSYGLGYVFNDDIDFLVTIQPEDGFMPITIGGKYYFLKSKGKSNPLAVWANAGYTFYSYSGMDVSGITLGGNVGYEMMLESFKVVPFVGIDWISATIAGGTPFDGTETSTATIIGVKADFTPSAKNKILGEIYLSSSEGTSTLGVSAGYTF